MEIIKIMNIMALITFMFYILGLIAKITNTELKYLLGATYITAMFMYRTIKTIDIYLNNYPYKIIFLNIVIIIFLILNCYNINSPAFVYITILIQILKVFEDRFANEK